MRDGRRRSPAVPDPISCTELVALRRKLGRPAMYQPLGKIVDTTDFRDEQGQLLYQEVRFEPKEFRLRRPAQEDDAVERVKRGWVWSMKGVPLVLYRLPEILAAIRDGLDVWIAEGPKDAKALVDAGAQATTNAMGADQWEDSYTFKLALAVVEHSSASQFIIVIDRDAAGDDRARDMAESFGRRGELAGRYRFVHAAEGKDAYDHLVTHGLGLADFDPYEVVPHPKRQATSRTSQVTVEFDGDRPSLRTMVVWGLARAREIGSRNRAAFDLGQQLNDNRFSRTEAWAIGLEYLERVNEELPNGHPLTEAEVRAAFRDAYALKPREPWSRRKQRTPLDQISSPPLPRPKTSRLVGGRDA